MDWGGGGNQGGAPAPRRHLCTVVHLKKKKEPGNSAAFPTGCDVAHDQHATAPPIVEALRCASTETHTKISGKGWACQQEWTAVALRKAPTPERR